MESMQTKPSAATQYMQVAMGWAMKGISLLTTSPETYSKIGRDSINLLEGFRCESETVSGQVDPTRVCDVVKQAMDPIKSFYRAGLVVTCALFFASRTVSILPVLPSLLLLFSAITGMITWDIHATLREMNHTYSYFNVLAKTSGRGIEFDQFVATVNEYSHRILSNTWIISGFNPIEDSLTNWGPHLIAQIRNQSEGGKASPWEIGAQYFPILPLICRVAEAADKRF